MLGIDVQQTVLYNNYGGKNMLAINYTNLRENMKECFDKITDSFEPLIVTRKSENMVIMSESYYDSLMETIYLKSSKKNYDHLNKSIAEYRNAELVEKDIIDD